MAAMKPFDYASSVTRSLTPRYLRPHFGQANASTVRLATEVILTVCA
jgi:hypothetical protein